MINISNIKKNKKNKKIYRFTISTAIKEIINLPFLHGNVSKYIIIIIIIFIPFWYKA
jgi:hypothetical protein